MSASTNGSEGVCQDCKRPLNEDELELNGLLCHDCDHYRREMRATVSPYDLQGDKEYPGE